MTEELLYAREYASEDERSQAIAIWNVHYNYHRPHSAAGGQPPASRLKTRVTNVRPSYNEKLIWLDRAVVDRLRSLRGPGESFSDVILRIVELGG
jgi:hypothetical protein